MRLHDYGVYAVTILCPCTVMRRNVRVVTDRTP